MTYRKASVLATLHKDFHTMPFYLLNKDALFFLWPEKIEQHVAEIASYWKDLTAPSERSYVSVSGSSLTTSS